MCTWAARPDLPFVRAPLAASHDPLIRKWSDEGDGASFHDRGALGIVEGSQAACDREDADFSDTETTIACDVLDP